MPTLIKANAMPAPTWHRLRMNDVDIELADSLDNTSSEGVVVKLESPDDTAPTDTLKLGADTTLFENALRTTAPKSTQSKRNLNADETADELDIAALSTYQQRAQALQENYTALAAFETGMGTVASDYLRENASLYTLVVPEGSTAKLTMHVEGRDGAVSVGALDVVLQKNATIELVIALNSPSEGTGVVGASLRLLASQQAQAQVSCVQTLSDGFTALEDSGLHLAEHAQVEFSHTVLGAGASYTGLAADLCGDESKLEIETSYLGARRQTRDFNYQITHRGLNSQSELNANGVLTGFAKKVFRGTIDLSHGCKGSQGSEQETVLLASPGVENKTVPVILCDEDDVAGNHGATIGHVRPEQLFYLQCRGLSADAAEELFVEAKLEDAIIKAPNETVKANVMRLGESHFEHFTELFAKENA